MGGRRLALVVLAACSAKSAPTTTKAKPATASTPAAPTGAGSATPTPQTPSGGAPASTAPASTATPAGVGLEATSLDRTVDPCVDVYQFACGGWLAANQIPPDRGRWGRILELDDKNKLAIKTLLEDAAAKNEPTTKKLGDYYASCMDEAAIEKAGTTGLKPLLDKTTKVKDAKSWLTALTELHKVGIWVVWAASADADLDQSTMNVSQLDAAGLGLPDRDYYVKPDFKQQLDGYQQHVARMLALAG